MMGTTASHDILEGIELATIGEEVAGLVVKVTGIEAMQAAQAESITALHRRLDSRPSWAVCVMLSGMGTTIGAMATFIASHHFI